MRGHSTKRSGVKGSKRALLWWLGSACGILLVLFVFWCARGSKHAPSFSAVQAPRPAAPLLESSLCLLGCPESTADSELVRVNTVIQRPIYVLSNNPRTKFADWVAYRVTQESIGKSKRRGWRADPDLDPKTTLEPEDYQGAHAALGTDRGHQVPLATFSGTEYALSLSFLSNSTPQRSEVNQQLWMRLENSVRRLVQKEEVVAVFVTTGLLFERNMPPLPGADESHEIPSGYFKIVAVEREGALVVAGFILDQDTKGRDSHCEHRATIRQIEKRAQLNFFVGLDDAMEEILETSEGQLYSLLGCRAH